LRRAAHCVPSFSTIRRPAPPSPPTPSPPSVPVSFVLQNFSAIPFSPINASIEDEEESLEADQAQGPPQSQNTKRKARGKNDRSLMLILLEKRNPSPEADLTQEARAPRRRERALVMMGRRAPLRRI
jgi:hypothetical protein